MEYLYSLYVFGFICAVIYHCLQFSKQIKILRRTSSAFFLGLETLKNIGESVVWPVTLVLTGLQVFFARGIVDESNELLSSYMGYSLEDDEDWED